MLHHPSHPAYLQLPPMLCIAEIHSLHKADSFLSDMTILNSCASIPS